MFLWKISKKKLITTHWIEWRFITDILPQSFSKNVISISSIATITIIIIIIIIMQDSKKSKHPAVRKKNFINKSFGINFSSSDCCSNQIYKQRCHVLQRPMLYWTFYFSTLLTFKALSIVNFFSLSNSAQFEFIKNHNIFVMDI